MALSARVGLCRASGSSAAVAACASPQAAALAHAHGRAGVASRPASVGRHRHTGALPAHAAPHRAFSSAPVPPTPVSVPSAASPSVPVPGLPSLPSAAAAYFQRRLSACVGGGRAGVEEAERVWSEVLIACEHAPPGSLSASMMLVYLSQGDDPDSLEQAEMLYLASMHRSAPPSSRLSLADVASLARMAGSLGMAEVEITWMTRAQQLFQQSLPITPPNKRRIAALRDMREQEEQVEERADETETDEAPTKAQADDPSRARDAYDAYDEMDADPSEVPRMPPKKPADPPLLDMYRQAHGPGLEPLKPGTYMVPPSQPSYMNEEAMLGAHGSGVVGNVGDLPGSSPSNPPEALTRALQRRNHQRAMAQQQRLAALFKERTVQERMEEEQRVRNEEAGVEVAEVTASANNATDAPTAAAADGSAVAAPAADGTTAVAATPASVAPASDPAAATPATPTFLSSDKEVATADFNRLDEELQGLLGRAYEMFPLRVLQGSLLRESLTHKTEFKKIAQEAAKVVDRLQHLLELRTASSVRVFPSQAAWMRLFTVLASFQLYSRALPLYQLLLRIEVIRAQEEAAKDGASRAEERALKDMTKNQRRNYKMKKKRQAAQMVQDPALMMKQMADAVAMPHYADTDNATAAQLIDGANPSSDAAVASDASSPAPLDPNPFPHVSELYLELNRKPKPMPDVQAMVLECIIESHPAVVGAQEGKRFLNYMRRAGYPLPTRAGVLVLRKFAELIPARVRMDASPIQHAELASLRALHDQLQSMAWSHAGVLALNPVHARMPLAQVLHQAYLAQRDYTSAIELEQRLGEDQRAYAEAVRKQQEQEKAHSPGQRDTDDSDVRAPRRSDELSNDTLYSRNYLHMQMLSLSQRMEDVALERSESGLLYAAGQDVTDQTLSSSSLAASHLLSDGDAVWNIALQHPKRLLSPRLTYCMMNLSALAGDVQRVIAIVDQVLRLEHDMEPEIPMKEDEETGLFVPDEGKKTRGAPVLLDNRCVGLLYKTLGNGTRPHRWLGLVSALQTRLEARFDLAVGRGDAQRAGILMADDALVNSYVRYLQRAGQRELVTNLLKELPSRHKEANHVLFLAALNAAIGDVAATEQTITQLQEHGVERGLQVYTANISSCQWPPNVDQAKAVWDDMIANGVVPDAYAYTCMLQVHMTAGKLHSDPARAVAATARIDTLLAEMRSGKYTSGHTLRLDARCLHLLLVTAKYIRSPSEARRWFIISQQEGLYESLPRLTRDIPTSISKWQHKPVPNLSPSEWRAHLVSADLREWGLQTGAPATVEPSAPAAPSKEEAAILKDKRLFFQRQVARLAQRWVEEQTRAQGEPLSADQIATITTQARERVRERNLQKSKSLRGMARRTQEADQRSMAAMAAAKRDAKVLASTVDHSPRITATLSKSGLHVKRAKGAAVKLTIRKRVHVYSRSDAAMEADAAARAERKAAKLKKDAASSHPAGLPGLVHSVVDRLKSTTESVSSSLGDGLRGLARRVQATVHDLLPHQVEYSRQPRRAAKSGKRVAPSAELLAEGRAELERRAKMAAAQQARAAALSKERAVASERARLSEMQMRRSQELWKKAQAGLAAKKAAAAIAAAARAKERGATSPSPSVAGLPQRAVSPRKHSATIRKASRRG